MKYLIFKVDEQDITLNNPLEMKVGQSTFIELTEEEFKDVTRSLLGEEFRISYYRKLYEKLNTLIK